jgi:hypothetical protein
VRDGLSIFSDILVSSESDLEKKDPG